MSAPVSCSRHTTGHSAEFKVAQAIWVKFYISDFKIILVIAGCVVL